MYRYVEQVFDNLKQKQNNITLFAIRTTVSNMTFQPWFYPNICVATFF